MEISDTDYRPGRDYLSNGEIEATGKLIGDAVANICRELLERRKTDRWILVSSGNLPALESTEDNGDAKYSSTVQMINAAGDQRTGIMWCVNGKISWEAYTDEAFDAVAWRPLPAPPEVNNG